MVERVYNYLTELLGNRNPGPEPSAQIFWDLEVFDHDSAALGTGTTPPQPTYTVEMCILRPFLDAALTQPYPVRHAIYSLHGANTISNTSFNHANRNSPYVIQAYEEGILNEPPIVIYPANGDIRNVPEDNWRLSPQIDQLRDEIFPLESEGGYTPNSVLVRTLNGHSLGGTCLRIANEDPQFAAATTTGGAEKARGRVVFDCARTDLRMYVVTHADDPTNPFPLTPRDPPDFESYQEWIPNDCGRIEMTADRPTDPDLNEFCTANKHAELCTLSEYYPTLFGVHQKAVEDVLGP